MPQIDSFKIQTGLPLLPDDSVPPQIYGAFLYLHQAIQNLQRGISQYTGIDSYPSSDWSSLTYPDTLLESQLTRMYPIASVVIARGQVVNLFNNAGVLNARLAVASGASTMAHGIANTSAGIGERLELNWLRGVLDSVGGMTLGTLYYLSTVAGAVQPGPPVNPGELVQPVGLALASSTLLMDIPLSFRIL